jgi:hypothetical protein
MESINNLLIEARITEIPVRLNVIRIFDMIDFWSSIPYLKPFACN